MSVYTDFAEVTARLATLPSILRARTEDVRRLEQNGNGEMVEGLAAKVRELRKACEEFEKALL